VSTSLTFDFFAGSMMGTAFVQGTYTGTAPTSLQYSFVDNDNSTQTGWTTCPYMDTTTFGAGKYGAVIIGPPNQALSGTILLRVTSQPTVITSTNLTGPVGPAEAVMPFRDMFRM
jgi:hypothetical protein